MADISQIQTPDGTIYTIKDPVARSGSFVAKTGDDMTGRLRLQRDPDNASANPAWLQFKDLDGQLATGNNTAGKLVGIITLDKYESQFGGLDWYIGQSSVWTSLSSTNRNSNGDLVSNELKLTTNNDGSCTYSVSSPANFRSAIGAAASNHTHTLSLASDSGTSQIALSANTKYKLTAGGNTVIFTTPSDTNTTYSAGTGISLSGTTFSNSGVRSISTGSANGTISVNTNGTSANVSVKGLGSAAYSNTSAFAAASHTHSYIPLSGSSTISGNLLRKLTNVTINKTSNNSCSSSSYTHNGWIDNASQYLAYVTCSAETDGKNSIGIHCKNMNTSGTATENYLGCRILKAGTRSYYVGDAAQFRSAIGAAASSSREYKKNIKPIEESEAKKILDVEVCSFDYKKGFGDKGHEYGQFGVIAEDVRELFPQAVNIPEHYHEMSIKERKVNNVLISVDYWKFLPHLIKVVQMQEQRINELEEKIKEMSK